MKKLTLAVLMTATFFTSATWADMSWSDPATWFEAPTAINLSAFPSDVNAQAELLSAKLKDVDPQVLKLGLEAYEKAKEQGLVHKPILTIIDYSRPSSEPRLIVLDLQHNTAPFQSYVAHGKNSGYDVASHFSNQFESLESSLGVFVTGQTYFGKHGLSLRLNGMERGVNDNALERGVVIHGAEYVNADVAKRFGRVGRSWGCPAVDIDIARPLINLIKGGTLVFAYYPDKHWLHTSPFLQA